MFLIPLYSTPKWLENKCNERIKEWPMKPNESQDEKLYIAKSKYDLKHRL